MHRSRSILRLASVAAGHGAGDCAGHRFAEDAVLEVEAEDVGEEPEIIDVQCDAHEEPADEGDDEELAAGTEEVSLERAAVERDLRVLRVILRHLHLEPRAVDADGDDREEIADEVRAEERAALAGVLEGADRLTVL